MKMKLPNRALPNKPNIGGIASKRGNYYEEKWAVYSLLEVISGQANSIQYEGIEREFIGFEFVLSRGQCNEWHQVKLNSPGGNWTARKLKYVLENFKRQLSENTRSKCVFVSQGSAFPIKDVSEKAHKAKNLDEFRSSASEKEKDCFIALTEEYWCVNPAVAFDWIGRCEFVAISELLIDKQINLLGNHLFFTNEHLFQLLSDYLQDNLNKKLTTEIVRSWIQDKSELQFRPASYDPTLREKIVGANTRYKKSYQSFEIAGKTISRKETKAILDLLLEDDGADLVLLTGEAGIGKSGIVGQVLTTLEQKQIDHLAFRMDRYLEFQSRLKLGFALLELDQDQSPVSVIANVASDQTAVLIVDQVDAVSESSGRNPATKELLIELVDECGKYNKVRCLLVCRSYDYRHDPQFQKLATKNKFTHIEVEKLDWKVQVLPILKKIGINLDSLSDKQNKLFKNTLNLYLFSQLKKDNQNITNQNDLFQRLLDVRRKELDLMGVRNWNIREPLYSMAESMNNTQSLICRRQVLENYDGAIDQLSSSGLIIHERKDNLAFFHESFFDFIYAKYFLTSNQSLIEFLRKSEQDLFVRTQVRQILLLKRDLHFEKYLAELKNIFSSSDVRMHIKYVVAEWLSDASNPKKEELDVILSLEDGSKKFSILLQKTLLQSDNWFELLNNRNWIEKNLEIMLETQQKQLLMWLIRVSNKHLKPVVKLLEKWSTGDTKREELLAISLCYRYEHSLNIELVNLLFDIFSKNSKSLFQSNLLLLGTLNILGKLSPQEGAKKLEEIFQFWFKENSNQHLFGIGRLGNTFEYELKDLSKNSPELFVSGSIPALIKSVNSDLESKNGYYLRYRYKTDDEYGSGVLLRHIRNALQTIAGNNPKLAGKYLDQLDPALHEAMMFLHLETIDANPKKLGHRLEHLLNTPHLFYAGYQNAKWLLFAETTRAVIQAKEISIENIESAIFQFRDELKQAKDALNFHKNANSDGRDAALDHLKEYGRVQLYVLKTIGKELLSESGSKKLGELERKFPSYKIPKPIVNISRTIGAPIDLDSTKCMADNKWLNEMEKYSHTESIFNSKGEFHEGASALSENLKAATEADPNRFARLIFKINTNVDVVYINRILSGIAAASKVDITLIQDALLHVFRSSKDEFGSEIANVIEKHPNIIQNEECLNMLLWFAEFGDATETIGTDSLGYQPGFGLFESLIDMGAITNGLNMTRGKAWLALEKSINEDNPCLSKIWDFLESRIKSESNIPVRVMMLYPLASMYNYDKQRFSECILNFTESITNKLSIDEALTPFTTNIGVWLYPRIESANMDIAIKIMERLINSTDPNKHLIGSWWTMCNRLRGGESTEKFPDIHELSSVHTQLWVQALCLFVNDANRTEYVLGELKNLFFHEEREVRKATGNVFRHIQQDRIHLFKDLAVQFIKSPAIKDNHIDLIQFLGKTTDDVAELVISAGEKILQFPQDAGKEIIYENDLALYELYELSDLLKREYVKSEGSKALRKRFLDLFDYIAGQGIHGVDELLKLDDRQADLVSAP